MRLLLLPLLLLARIAVAQPPPGYYDSAQGLTGEALRAALNDIISPHSVLAYTQLWEAFSSTDQAPDGGVWDIYSDVPGGTPPYEFQFVVDQCGNYDSEGDCFNREHTFPVSWFNDGTPMNTDLHHIYPTDAWVNQQRGNWPYGEVTAPAWTSQNGGKRGPCSLPGCSGTVFEPIDEYKGDLARGHFYMLTRYLNESVSWPAPILSSGAFVPWAESLLLAWHAQDAVSDKERDRNNAVFGMQGNRNPYIDNPDWAYSIWGPEAGVDEHPASLLRISVTDEGLQISVPQEWGLTPMNILDASGRTVKRLTLKGGTSQIDFECVSGIYLMQAPEAGQVIRFVR